MRRRDGFDKGIIFLLFIVLILAGTGVFLYAKLRTNKVGELVKTGHPFTVALLVTDKNHLITGGSGQQVTGSPITGALSGGSTPSASSAKKAASAASSSSGAGGAASGSAASAGGRGSGSAGASSGSDLLFTELLSYDPKTHQGALLDVPGNVGSLISSVQKIEPIDVLFQPGKVTPYRKKLENLVGASIPVYIEMDISQVSKLVDLLGGVTLFIPNPIREASRSPMILLPSGSVTLDGSKIYSYLSYRSPTDSSIEIIARRQRFVQALLKALGEHASLFGKPGVYATFKEWERSNMNRHSMLSFIDMMSKLNTQKMLFQRVLGVDRMVGNQELLFPHYNGRLLRQTMQQTLASLANPKSSAAEAANVRLQVLNGTFENGLAHRTSQIFQSFGYDVVAVGNASRQNYANTEIIDRTGNISQAQKVAHVIRCTRIVSQPPAHSGKSAGATATASQGAKAPSSAAYDVTVILGKNFDGRYCK